MGATFTLPIVSTQELATELNVLREQHGMTLVAAVASTSGESLAKLEPIERVAILFGNESSGLNEQWVSMCDRRVTIPMAPGSDSLNVAVATGIVLYHVSNVRSG